MSVNYKAELVGLLGDPVNENPTGVMQEAAFAALGLNWRYLTIEVKPDKLAEAMTGVRAFGMQGLNLTMPHKVAVMDYLDEIAPAAKAIGAVNTVRREAGRLIGENTDGKGFLRGVRVDAGVGPAGKRVVILGAGGAARAIATELALAGASDLVIVNRTQARGEAMVNDLHASTSANVHFEVWKGTYQVPSDADVLVNATSIGLYPDVDGMPDVSISDVNPDMLVGDVVFYPSETRLIQAAKARGLPVLDGLSMLVYQGVLGFEMWTGKQAPVQIMKDALEKALAS